MDRILSQWTKLWQLLSNPDTLATYQKASSLTWNILQESAKLFLLLFFLIVVLFSWMWNSSINLGRNVRAWVDGFEKPAPEKLASEASNLFLAAAKNSVTFTLSKARNELGLPEPPPPPEPVVQSEPVASIQTSSTASKQAIIPDQTLAQPSSPKTTLADAPVADSEPTSSSSS